MAAKNTKQVEVIDLSGEPYEADNVKQKIYEKYGVSGDFNHIYLKRKNKSGQMAQLRKYAELPDEEDVKNEFGGGEYEVWVYFNDENTSSGRNFTKVPMIIEGTSIIPDYAGTNKPAASEQLSEDDREKKFLDKLAMYKTIFGSSGNQENGKFDLVIKMIENQNSTILEMIKSNNSGKSSKLDEIILAKAFERNSSDLDIFLKAQKIFSAGNSASPDELGWLKEMAPTLVKLLLAPKPPLQAAGMNSVPAVNAPAGDQLTQTLNQLINAVNTIGTKVDNFEVRLSDIENNLEIIPDDENTPAERTGDTVMSEVNTAGNEPVNQNKPDPAMQLLADQIKNAPEAEQLSALKMWVNNSSAKDTYEWCLTYGIIKDLADFNLKMKAAELQPLEL